MEKIKILKQGLLILLTLGSRAALAGEAPLLRAWPAIILSPGFLTKIRCEGRLLISAIGNEALVELQALPKELGCGVLLKPIARSGKTNLILETSTGTISRAIEIKASEYAHDTMSPIFEIELKAEGRE